MKHSKKADEQKPAPDPLSGAGKEEVIDPLTSLALASSADPLSAVLADPLSKAARASFGGSSIDVCQLLAVSFVYSTKFSRLLRMQTRTVCPMSPLSPGARSERPFFPPTLPPRRSPSPPLSDLCV